MCQTLGDSSYDSLAIKCVCMLQLKWTVSIERRTKAGHGGWQKTNKNRDPFLGCFKRPVKETKKAQSRDLKQARWVNQKIWARLMDKGERVNVKCTSIEKRFPTQLSTKSAFLLEVSFTHAQKPSYRPMPKHFFNIHMHTNTGVVASEATLGNSTLLYPWPKDTLSCGPQELGINLLNIPLYYLSNSQEYI